MSVTSPTLAILNFDVNFDVNFDETLHHRLEPKIKIEFIGDQSLTITYPIFLNRVYLRSGGRVLNI